MNQPKNPQEPNPHGHIRSFVLRQGHLSAAQQRSHETLMPVYGVPYAEGLIDYSKVFERSAPTILEIGFGMGETTAKIAASKPDHNFLGIEVHTPGVGSLLKLIHAQNIANVRIVQHDAVEVIRDMIPMNSLAGVHVFFPDPWHKKRHNKRRLLQGPLVKSLAERLAPGGYLHCATDWEDYAMQMLEVLGAEPLLENTATDFAPRPDYRPQTKFETRGLRLGHGVWDVVFKRK